MNFANRLKTARKAARKTQAQVAEYLGIDTSSVTHWESGKSQPTANRIEALARFLGVTAGNLLDNAAQNNNEVTPATASSPFDIPPISNKRIPVYGVAIGGDCGAFQMNGEIIDYVFCPPGLEKVPGAYAIFIQGESMEPLYTAGQTVWIHPNRPVRQGDDVVVQVRKNDYEPPMGFIKRYVRKTADFLVVKQFNPPRDIEYDIDQVVSCHRIVFAER